MKQVVVCDFTREQFFIGQTRGFVRSGITGDG
jgi:hypothetical protein